MEGDFFHILNRGVEEREIFYSDEDYLRFANNFHDFNNTEIALPYRIRRSKQIGRATSDRFISVQKEIVNLLCWCLMPNHVHSLVQEQVDSSASLFSKKIFGGYTKYINETRKRKGVLFQGRSKIILIEKDEHFFHLPFYIMGNPVSLIEPAWKEKGIYNLEKVIKFLENYRWSSLPDLIGKENFSENINKSLFYELFDTNETRFKKDFIEWLSSYKPSPNLERFID